MAPPGLEDRSSERGEEDEVDEQPDRPELCGDGERSRVRDVLALPSSLRLPLSCSRAAASRFRRRRPDARRTRPWSPATSGCGRSSPAVPSRRRLRARTATMPAARTSAADSAHDDAAGQPVAGEQRRRRARRRRARRSSSASRRSRGRPSAGRGRGSPTAGRTSRARDREEHDDPEDEVAAVDARILEDGRHAEERRVRVRRAGRPAWRGSPCATRPGRRRSRRTRDVNATSAVASARHVQSGGWAPRATTASSAEKGK